MTGLLGGIPCGMMQSLQAIRKVKDAGADLPGVGTINLSQGKGTRHDLIYFAARTAPTYRASARGMA
jgi:hypothetical protein